jgi:hydrogenase maturation protease
MVILGIGNVLQKDDGFGVYASTYLKENYTFSKDIKIINGGVEGINLFSIFEENENILILDTIELKDTPASIYLLPADELTGHGLNSGGAHEIGVLQCLDMLELQAKPLPNSTILGIVPQEVTFEISLTKTLTEAFESYINVALKFLKDEKIEATKKDKVSSLEEIINRVKDPSGVMT